jgi:hypothetical protein
MSPGLIKTEDVALPGVDRQIKTDHFPDERRLGTRGVDHEPGFDPARGRHDCADLPAVQLDPGHRRVLEELHAASAGAGCVGLDHVVG